MLLRIDILHIGGMRYMYYRTTSHGMQPRLLKTVTECFAECEGMITMCLGMADVQARTKQIQLLRDCASICETTACFLARNSMFVKMCAHLCAYICEVCGHECMKHADTESQRCGQICLHCAQECKSFSMMQ